MQAWRGTATPESPVQDCQTKVLKIYENFTEKFMERFDRGIYGSFRAG